MHKAPVKKRSYKGVSYPSFTNPWSLKIIIKKCWGHNQRGDNYCRIYGMQLLKVKTIHVSCVIGPYYLLYLFTQNDNEMMGNLWPDLVGNYT